MENPAKILIYLIFALITIGTVLGIYQWGYSNGAGDLNYKRNEAWIKGYEEGRSDERELQELVDEYMDQFCEKWNYPTSVNYSYIWDNGQGNVSLVIPGA